MALRRNIYVSVLGTWAASTFAFVTTVFVSRLLTPREIGVFTIGLSIAALVSALQNFGTKEFLVQKVDLLETQRKAAFGVSLLAGVAASIFLIAVSVPLAWFYETPELAGVTLILAGNPVLQSLATPVAGMLGRERLFVVVSAISVASAAVSTATAITLSLLGFSFYSLAIASLISTAVSVAGHWLLGWRFVIWRPTFAGTREILSFGTKVYLANLLTALQLSTTELIIGKVLGLPSAAMLHRANAVNMIYVRFVNRAVDALLTAEYAAQNRMGGEVARAFLAATRHMSALAWPFFGAMAIFAEPVILLLYGDQWTDAIVPMQILCIASAFWPLNSPAIGVLIGLGAVDLNLRIRIFTSIVRVSMILIAAHYGLNAVAGAVALSALFVFVLFTAGVRSRIQFSVREYVESLMPSAITTAVTLMAAGGGYWIGLGSSNFPRLMVGAAFTGLGWVLGLYLARHPFLGELQLLVRRALSFPRLRPR